MKLLPKITIILVAILSCCSCSKGKKVDKEEFLEKIKEIKTNDSYKTAKIEGIFITEQGKYFDVESHCNNVSAIYEKNENGNWVKKSQNNDYSDYYDRDINHYLNDYKLNENFSFLNVKFLGGEHTIDEEYFIKPFTLNLTTTSKRNKFLQDGYYIETDTDNFVWNEYGDVTYFLQTSRYDGDNFVFFKREIKITYE